MTTDRRNAPASLAHFYDAANDTAVPASIDSGLPVQMAGPSSAFGEVSTAPRRTVIAASGRYNFLPANWRTFSATGGSADVAGGEFRCQTGTSVGGYGVVRSFRSANYKPGVGVTFRGSGRFTSPVALSQQAIGLFNIGDEFSFGYNGTTFGIFHRYGGKGEVQTLTIATPSSGSTDATITMAGTAYTVPLTSGTAAHNAYEIATWFAANVSVWVADQNGDTVVFLSQSDGDKTGTFSFTHGTAVAAFAETTAGVTKTTNHIAQSSWNIDTASWLDPTKGNVYQIQYQGGYGDALFAVLNPDTGRFAPVHRIAWANNNTTRSLGNPSLRPGVYAYSLGSTTNMTAYASEMSAFVDGGEYRIRNPRSFGNSKSVSTTATELFAVRCRRVINGLPNQIEIQPDLLTVYTESTKGATFYLLGNPTVSGEPNFAYLNETSSVAETDTAGTTVTGGTPLLEVNVTGRAVIPLSDLFIRIPPTLRLVVAAKINSGGASADTGAALTWYEDI